MKRRCFSLLVLSLVSLASSATPLQAAAQLIGLGRLSGTSPADAYEISSDGRTVVGTTGPFSQLTPSKWTAETGWVSLGNLPGATRGYALGVSSDGSVIAGDSQSSASLSAVRYVGSSGPMNLGLAPNGFMNAAADGISADGGVIVGRTSDGVG
ncbi:MAG: hypothetical protein KDA33_03080, partial [Phycisphaerales bacterium]|nr:hypothetical protein [Phycisphaerales bacterium]